MVNCSPLRRVGFFFIQLFTICIKYIKKNNQVIKKRYASKVIAERYSNLATAKALVRVLSYSL
ncbi:hypothetical protein DWQ65_00325 [Treponema phagedenis]|nr:hypothetical protein FUT82_13155 [Treponema phagedenis]QSH94037.1 hypothetical protein C5O78_03055 [Treponema phagedenis]QSH98536.1 hypothetical protein DWQ65_00325 [Treponema phagedenis]